MVSSDCVICPRSRRTLCCLRCIDIAILESGRRKQGLISEEGTALTAKRTEHVVLATPSREEVVIGAMEVFFRDVAAHAEQSASGVTDPVERVDAYLATRASDMSTMSQGRYEYRMSNDAIRGIYGSAVDACAELLANYLARLSRWIAFVPWAQRSLPAQRVCWPSASGSMICTGLAPGLPRLARHSFISCWQP